MTGICAPLPVLLATYSMRLGDTDAVYTDGLGVSHSHQTAKNVVSSPTSKSDLLSCIFLIALALVVYVSRNVANFNDLPFNKETSPELLTAPGIDYFTLIVCPA